MRQLYIAMEIRSRRHYKTCKEQKALTREIYQRPHYRRTPSCAVCRQYIPAFGLSALYLCVSQWHPNHAGSRAIQRRVCRNAYKSSSHTCKYGLPCIAHYFNKRIYKCCHTSTWRNHNSRSFMHQQPYSSKPARQNQQNNIKC